MSDIGTVAIRICICPSFLFYNLLRAWSICLYFNFAFLSMMVTFHTLAYQESVYLSLKNIPGLFFHDTLRKRSKDSQPSKRKIFSHLSLKLVTSYF